MRRGIILLFLLFSVCALYAEYDGWWEFHSELDLYLSLKAGAEYHFTDHFGLRGSVGALLIGPSQISYTMIGISHLKAPENPFQLDIQYGLVHAVFDVIAPLAGPCAYWGPGACIAAGYRTPGGHCFRFRAGGEIMFGYDVGMWQDAEFMPNIGLEYGYSFYR